MISRRSIRIKVMQSLFAFEINDGLTRVGLIKNLKKGIQSTYDLYVYNFLMITKILEYAEKHNELQNKKFMEDQKRPLVDLRILENPFYVKLKEEESFKNAVKDGKLDSYLDKEVIKSCFNDFLKHSAYQSYSENKKPNTKQHIKLLNDLFKKVMCKSDVYVSHLEECYINWIDDKKMIINAITGSLKARLEKNPPALILDQPQDWKERKDFGQNLLDLTLEKNKEYVDLITPQLINWEFDRVNNIDVLLLKMSLAELLYFPTIPVKVTINEYIEIAKRYSTPKSKDFVNGILDAMLKKLRQDGRIQKLGRGLVES